MVLIILDPRISESNEDKLSSHHEWTVVLIDGHSPRIFHKGRSFSTTLEATSCARWCKILALKSIRVVCSKMKICWYTNAERMDDVIIHEEYDNENGLFGLAAILLEGKEKEEKFEEHAQLLIEMLHCYILPIINFKTRDIPPIVTALAAQDVCLECLDANIMAQTNRVEGFRTTLMTFLEDDVRPQISTAFGSQCPRDFLELIIKDINKQEVEIREKSEKSQYYVDEAKAALTCNDSIANKEKLQKARAHRDMYFYSLQTLLVLRETAVDALRTTLEEKNAREGSFENWMMKNYKTIRQEFINAKLELFNMCKFKVCALTIRESLYTLREQLTNKGFSQGTGYYCDSCTETDGQVQSQTDHQSIAEKLAMVFQTNRQLRVTALEFVKKTERCCSDIMKVLVGSGNRGEKHLLAWDTVSTAVKSLLQKMKSDVQKHFHDTAPELAGAMTISYRSRGDAEMQIQSIQLAYEEHVFSKLGKCIELIYEMVNEETAEQIVNNVEKAKRMNRDDLVRDLELDNEWWLDWFSEGEVRQLPDLPEDNDNFTRQRSYSCPRSCDLSQDDEDEVNSEDEFNIIDLFTVSPQTNSQLVYIQFAEHSSFMPSYTPVLSGNTISQVKVGKNPRSLSLDAPTTNRRPRAASCPDGRSVAGLPGITESVATILSHLQPPVEEVDGENIKCIPNKDWLVIEKDEEPPDVIAEGNVIYSTEKKPEFLEHFGRALDYIRDTFHEPAPINKLKCLRAALVECTSSVEELRYQKCKDYLKNAVAAHELIPFTILILRELESSEIALLYSQIAFLEDYMASFLTAGVYSWSLTMITASHKELVAIGKRRSQLN